MVPNTFVSFFAAMAGAGATLFGLLFVAVSLRPELTCGADEVAEGSLVALGNGFVVSAFALIPNVNVVYAALPMSAIGLFAVTRIAVRLAGAREPSCSDTRWLFRAATMGPTVFGYAMLGCEVYVALRLLAKPNDEATVRWLAGLVVASYAVALLRSWMLLGGSRRGLRAALLPPREQSRTQQ